MKDSQIIDDFQNYAGFSPRNIFDDANVAAYSGNGRVRMKRREVSSVELKAQFKDQLGALQRLVQDFDNGYYTEARRLAVILRVLFHSRKDPSLLKRLGLEATSIVDTSPALDPENLLSFHGLVSLKFENGEWSYAPKLDTDSPPTRTPVDQWWNGVVFSDSKNRRLTRADVVLTAANQDGGAHVDGRVREDYAELHFENSLGWLNDQGKPPSGDVRYVAIRQMAHEVLKTFIPGYSKTLADIQASKRQSEISGGKMRFYPHERRFFINSLAEPLTPGATYMAEILIDSITAGSVHMQVSSTRTEAIKSAGKHRVVVQAGMDKSFGVFGEYTDAIIDRVSLRQMILRR